MLESKEISSLMMILSILPLVTQMPVVVLKLLQTILVINPWITRPLAAPFSLTSVCSPILIVWKIRKYRRELMDFVEARQKSKVSPIVNVQSPVV